MLAANRITRSLLAGTNKRLVFRQARATYIRGFWPEPITQQTLDEFLADINYFEEPKKFVNIGLELDRSKEDNLKISKKQVQPTGESQATVDVDKILDLLSEDSELPALDLDDADVDRNQLMRLAVSSGVYRDLFGEYIPNREHIKFTQEQAERLDKLVPHFWITDQPFARVERNCTEPEPLQYFEPVVRVSARFIQDAEDTDDKYSHNAYHGNLIPACEANSKPAITIDGCWSSSDYPCDTHTRESRFDNWQPGQVTCENLPSISTPKYYTLLLLNLDSIHPGHANLHWMVTNIDAAKSKSEAGYDEVCEYLPVHGIRGFGYSRYVFLVLQHESKFDTVNARLNDFLPETRKFDAKSFLSQHSDIKMTPVGMSWFQTVWDASSNDIFHKYMNMKAPTYEHVQEKLEKVKFTNMAYPGKIPFNIFMDHYRDPKEIEERVLLERLSSVDPFDYKDQYVKPRVPPTVFDEETRQPDWMYNVNFKRRNRAGYYRGLRPASATIPLNNNADLDNPIRPILSSRRSPPGFPNPYPAKPFIKRIKDLPYSKPANEQTNVFVQDGSEIYIGEVKNMMEGFRKTKNKIKKSEK